MGALSCINFDAVSGYMIVRKCPVTTNDTSYIDVIYSTKVDVSFDITVPLSTELLEIRKLSVIYTVSSFIDEISFLMFMFNIIKYNIVEEHKSRKSIVWLES